MVALRFLHFAILITILVHCSPIPESALQKVDRTTTIAMVDEAPTAFLNHNLLVGGVIIDHEFSDRGSVLELEQWQITSWGEPISYHSDARRFFVKSNQTLDPTIYQPGKIVTLTGRVTGSDMRRTQQIPDRYSMLTLDEIHIWDTPFRYGIHPYQNRQFPYYVGPESFGRTHPYSPGLYAYPYSPYWFRSR
ncbi:MAG: Slp family lipoprotein [Deltaproteobacteria bacterium]|jgi:outer membrane lipoprotein|nr:Slp family lipoprotein [Deltaproteobacteria bacterium]